jgi:hypothetical protein
VLLAEAISLDAGEVAAILIVLALFCAAAIACVVLGFVWAGRAARGSERAIVGFGLVAGLETLLALPSVIAGVRGRLPVVGLVVPLIIAAQDAVYIRARARREQPASTRPAPPNPPAPPGSD